jgi:integrase/recombinase XerD
MYSVNEMVNPIERFLNFLTVEKGLSPNTVVAYRTDMNKFQKYLKKLGRNLTGFTKNDIISYLNVLRDTGNQTPTIARNITTIRGLCRFMLSEGIIKNDPVENLNTPRGWKNLPRILGIDDVFSLLEKPAGKTLSLRDRAMLELLYSSGLRASEIIDLKVHDINFEAGFITVMGKGSKERVVPINERALKLIKKYAKELRPMLLKKKTTQHLFLAKGGNSMTRQRLWQLIRLYSKDLPLKISPHTLRHCFASHLLDGGADLRALQKMLGHADISTTQIYTKVAPEKLKKIHKDHHPRG